MRRPSNANRRRTGVWAHLRRDRFAILGFGILAFFVLAAAFAGPIAAIYGDSPDTTHPELLDQNGFPLGLDGGISAAHWLGVTPADGRDLFLQVIYGARTSLGIAMVAGVLATLLGVVLGLVAGYLGTWVDGAVTFLTDVTLAFPVLFFAFAAIPVFNVIITGSPERSGGMWAQVVSMVAVLVLFGWPGSARLVRGEVIALRERAYVEASVACGGGSRWILWRHLAPNLMPQLTAALALTMPGFITVEAALSFLQLGIPPPVPDWGRLVYQSIPYIQEDWAFTIIPGLAVFAVVAAFNLIAEAIRRALSRTAEYSV